MLFRFSIGWLVTSEKNVGAQTYDEFITNKLAGIAGIDDAAARAEHILEIPLYLPPRTDLGEVGQLEVGFAGADRGKCPAAGVLGKESGVGVKGRRAWTDMRIAHPESQDVVGPVRQRIVIDDPQVHAEINEVAIALRCPHHSAESADGAIRIVALRPQHLIGDGIDRIVA